MLTDFRAGSESEAQTQDATQVFVGEQPPLRYEGPRRTGRVSLTSRGLVCA